MTYDDWKTATPPEYEYLGDPDEDPLVLESPNNGIDGWYTTRPPNNTPAIIFTGAGCYLAIWDEAAGYWYDVDANTWNPDEVYAWHHGPKVPHWLYARSEGR